MKTASPRSQLGGRTAACPVRAAASTSGFNGGEHGDVRCKYRKSRRFGHDILVHFVIELEFEHELEHRLDARRQFPDVPHASDDATAKSEPARSAGHQSIHPAARPVRLRRAAA